MSRANVAVAVALALAGCASTPAEVPVAEVMALSREAERTLDALHAAAAAADEARYFGLFAKDGVFLGTDAPEGRPETRLEVS